jgi:hypothetical protein
MRIEGDDHRCAVGRMSVPRGGGNDGLMPAMNAVKDADSEKKRTPQGSQVVDGTKNLQSENDE